MPETKLKVRLFRAKLDKKHLNTAKIYSLKCRHIVQRTAGLIHFSVNDNMSAVQVGCIGNKKMQNNMPYTLTSHRHESPNRCQVDKKTIKNQTCVLGAFWQEPRGHIRRTDLDPFREPFSNKKIIKRHSKINARIDIEKVSENVAKQDQNGHPKSKNNIKQQNKGMQQRKGTNDAEKGRCRNAGANPVVDYLWAGGRGAG